MTVQASQLHRDVVVVAVDLDPSSSALVGNQRSELRGRDVLVEVLREVWHRRADAVGGQSNAKQYHGRRFGVAGQAERIERKKPAERGGGAGKIRAIIRAKVGHRAILARKPQAREDVCKLVGLDPSGGDVDVREPFELIIT